MSTGKISWVNLWDRVLTNQELEGLDCMASGNIVNWDTLRHMGNIFIFYEDFPCTGNMYVAIL